MSSFGKAQAQSRPSGTVHPLGFQTDVVRPKTVTRNPDGVFSIDFALDTFGQFVLELPAIVAADVGRKVTVRVGERLSSNGRLSPKPGGSRRFVQSELTLEAWDDRYKPNEDWNQAWGAAPASLLPRKVPTARGPIKVSWKHRTTGVELSVDVPENVTAELRLPPTWGPAVSRDGKAFATRSVEGTLAVELTGPFSGVLSVGRSLRPMWELLS
jgi:hypothetical protein